MPEMTLPEVQRLAESNQRRFSDTVYKEVYTRDMAELRKDIGEIKESNRWAMRLIAAQFVTLVVALLAYFATNWPT